MTATDTPNTWKCPGCGAIVSLPQDFAAGDEPPTEKRLNQLAQALCGCWVVTMPDRGLDRLLAVILGGDRSPRLADTREKGGTPRA